MAVKEDQLYPIGLLEAWQDTPTWAVLGSFRRICSVDTVNRNAEITMSDHRGMGVIHGKRHRQYHVTFSYWGRASGGAGMMRRRRRVASAERGAERTAWEVALKKGSHCGRMRIRCTKRWGRTAPRSQSHRRWSR
jgi:hypothetical protein